MTTLFPGMSLPSASAASTIRFAIRSLTEPPADVYSSLPTADEKQADSVSRSVKLMVGSRTEITLQAFMAGQTVQANKWRIAYSAKCIVENDS